MWSGVQAKPFVTELTVHGVLPLRARILQSSPKLLASSTCSIPRPVPTTVLIWFRYPAVQPTIPRGNTPGVIYAYSRRFQMAVTTLEEMTVGPLGEIVVRAPLCVSSRKIRNDITVTYPVYPFPSWRNLTPVLCKILTAPLYPFK